MDDIVKKINELYNSPDGLSGGYGHIVFDDHNIETKHIEWCIEQAEDNNYNFCEETRQKSIVALKAMMLLSEQERQEVINKSFDVRYSR